MLERGKARAPQLGWVLLLRPSPPHFPLLAFLRTDAFHTNDRPIARQWTPADHPPTHQPRARMGLAEGAAHCSAAPSALPCLPQRSPSQDPLHWLGALGGGNTQVLTLPMTTPEGTWSHMGAEPHHPTGGRWDAFPPEGIFCSLAGWQLFL